MNIWLNNCSKDNSDMIWLEGFRNKAEKDLWVDGTIVIMYIKNPYQSKECVDLAQDRDFFNYYCEYDIELPGPMK